MEITKIIKMDLSAKIAELLSQSHYLTKQNLSEYAKQQNIRVQLLKYGAKHPNQVVCSFMASVTGSNANQCDRIGHVLTGTVLLHDIIQMTKSGKYTMQKVLPVGAFDTSFSYDQFMVKLEKQPLCKNGSIIQRTLRSRHNLRAKDDNKPLIKKQSQTSADVNKSIKSTPIQNAKNTNMNNNKLPKQNTINANTKKQPNVNSKTQLKIKQQQKQQQQEEMKQMMNKMKPSRVQSQAMKIKKQSQSQNQEQMLKNYNIQPTCENNRTQPKLQAMKFQSIQIQKNTIKQQQNEQQVKVQLTNKVADLQLDQQQQLKLFLQQQKNKNKKNDKPENKNINIGSNVRQNTANKLQKKTTDRIPVTNTVQKNKSQTQHSAQPIKSGKQGTLLQYLNNKK